MEKSHYSSRPKLICELGDNEVMPAIEETVETTNDTFVQGRTRILNILILKFANFCSC